MNVLDRMYLRVKYGLYDFFTDEKGDVNVVSIVVLIGIAVALALIFKQQIGTLIKTLTDTVETQAENAINGNGV